MLVRIRHPSISSSASSAESTTKEKPVNITFLNEFLREIAVAPFVLDSKWTSPPGETKYVQITHGPFARSQKRVIFEGRLDEYKRWRRLRILCNENETVETMELADRELWPLFVCTPYLRTWLCNHLSDSETQSKGMKPEIADAEYIFSTMPDRAKKSIIGDAV